MKSTGIVRKVDELGRVVLPIELRKSMQINEKDEIEIFVEGETIVLKKHQEMCIFCGSSDGITKFKGKNVCEKCKKYAKEI